MKRLLWGMIFATALFGQSADTGILGSVSDQSGSLIVGATGNNQQRGQRHQQIGGDRSRRSI